MSSATVRFPLQQFLSDVGRFRRNRPRSRTTAPAPRGAERVFERQGGPVDRTTSSRLIGRPHPPLIPPPPTRRFAPRVSAPTTEPIGIAMLGCGVVGSGVVRILGEQRELLRKRTGLTFDLRHVVVRDPSKHREHAAILPLTTDAHAAIDDVRVKIVLELMGGADPAFRADRARAAPRQTRRHRKQESAGRKGDISLFHGAPARRVRRLRGELRRRHPDHPRADGRARRQPHRCARRHRQRHLQHDPHRR